MVETLLSNVVGFLTYVTTLVFFFMWDSIKFTSMCGRHMEKSFYPSRNTVSKKSMGFNPLVSSASISHYYPWNKGKVHECM